MTLASLQEEGQQTAFHQEHRSRLYPPPLASAFLPVIHLDPMEPAIRATGIRKTYHSGFWRRRTHEVLRGVDLTVPVGTIFGILGPNGAGKTTLISILATLLIPEAGQITVLGVDALGHRRRLQQQINLASGAANFLWSLTVVENLFFYGRLYGLRGRALTRRVDELIELFELTEHRRASFDKLSSGLKQRLALAKSLINSPRLLFLDEPTTGLDPIMARHTREEIRRLNESTGLTILLTTHNMREAEFLCDEVAFLHGGRIQGQGSIPALQEQLALGDRLLLTFPDRLPALAFDKFPGVLAVQPRPPVLELIVDHGELRLPAILRELLCTDIHPVRVQYREADLEDLYREFTR